MIVTTICSFSNSTSASLRQASCYGIGIVAQNSGDAFPLYAEICLNALKGAVDFPITPKIENKKIKLT